jgi:hypothetical protein
MFIVSFSTVTMASLNTKYALLVGINDYPVKPLKGPQFDVIAVKKALKNKMGFKSDKITTLLNEKATKANILNAIDDLNKVSKKGDQIFIYFSGHGTSASDNNFKFPLPTTTGAFIPYDVIPNSESALPNLIVGRTDLRPRLAKLDQGGRSVFMVMDACYSGNAVRGIQNSFTLTERYLNLNKALSGRGISMDWDKSYPEPNDESNVEAYPYQNIYFLSAAGEHEVALEISEARLNDYPTIDGKPHGAFTDSLLRVFNDPMKSDQDKNGEVSYVELRSALRTQMETRKFNHTPQGLPNLIDDTNNLNNAEVLLWSTRDFSLNSSAPSKTTGKTKKAIVPKSPIKQTVNINKTKLLFLDSGLNLNNVPKGIEITLNKGLADYSLVGVDESKFVWLAATGDIIKETMRPTEQQIIKQLNYLLWRDEIKTLSKTGSHAVQVNLIGSGKGATARRNDTIGFTVNLPDGGQVMLVNADANGDLTILYPGNNSELEKFKPGSLVKLPNFANIQPPFGQDTLLAIAFKGKQALIKDLTNTTFSFDSNTANSFKSMLNKDQSNQWGLDYLTLTTTP